MACDDRLLQMLNARHSDRLTRPGRGKVGGLAGRDRREVSGFLDNDLERENARAQEERGF